MSSKERNYREPRRRGFDDDHFGASRGGSFEPPPRFAQSRPPQARAPSGPPIDAVVKWFNPEKGFGFVSPADGSPDVFLHVSALKQAGLQDAPEGSTILCEVGPGRKGVQVLRVITLDTTTAVQRPPRRPMGPRQYDR